MKRLLSFVLFSLSTIACAPKKAATADAVSNPFPSVQPSRLSEDSRKGKTPEGFEAIKKTWISEEGFEITVTDNSLKLKDALLNEEPKKFNLDLDFGTSYVFKSIESEDVAVVNLSLHSEVVDGENVDYLIFTYTDADKRLDAVKMYEKSSSNQTTLL